MERLPAWRWWLAAVGAALGYLVGVLIAVSSSSGGRAEASVLITSPRGPAVVKPLLPNLRELATSSVLAGNVRSTLRLRESEEAVRHRLHASIRPQSQVIVIRATGSDGDHARQLAQEAAVVYAQLVDARFRSLTPPLRATVFDAAHALSSPRPIVKDSLFGAAIGLALGVLLAGTLGRKPRATAAAVDPRALARREALLEQRLDLVSARERAVARRAGELAVQLAERAKQSSTETALAAGEAQEADEAEAVESEEPSEVTAPASPVATAKPSEPLLRAGGPSLNIHRLEQLVAAQRDAPPERVSEWQTYLFLLREHADPEGRLPPAFESLVADVFGSLLE